MACSAECQMCVLDRYSEIPVHNLVNEGFFVVIPSDSLVPYHFAVHQDTMGALLVWQRYTIWGKPDSLTVQYSWRPGCPPAIHEGQHLSSGSVFVSCNRSLARSFWGCSQCHRI